MQFVVMMPGLGFFIVYKREMVPCRRVI